MFSEKSLSRLFAFRAIQFLFKEFHCIFSTEKPEKDCIIVLGDSILKK